MHEDRFTIVEDLVAEGPPGEHHLVDYQTQELVSTLWSKYLVLARQELEPSGWYPALRRVSYSLDSECVPGQRLQRGIRAVSRSRRACTFEAALWHADDGRFVHAAEMVTVFVDPKQGSIEIPHDFWRAVEKIEGRSLAAAERPGPARPDPWFDRPTRLGPLPEAERTPRQQAVIDDLVVGPTVNIYTTLTRHPDLAAAMVNLGRTLRAGRLTGRHREILILRTGWNCQSAYELEQHRRMALEIGFTPADLARIRRGPDAQGWDPFEVQLCRAADEIHAHYAVSDATWAALAAVYDEFELIEAVMLVGYYHLVSFVLNTLGVPLETGAPSAAND